MTQWPTNHLTADDLDAFHSASLSVEARNHLEACPECRELARRDRALLAALASLPAFEPAPGFTERVLARVERPEAVRSRWRRPQPVALAAALLLALGGSAVWSLFNRALLLSWLDSSAASLGRALWSWVRVAATNLSEQPWLAALGTLVSSTGRAALLGGVLLAGYAVALIALRRLLLSPSRAVPHANG